MALEIMSAEQYRALDFDALEERKQAIIDAYDADDADFDMLDAESRTCAAEYDRRNKKAKMRSLAINEVKEGAGKVVEKSGTPKVQVVRDNSLGARAWEEMKRLGYTRDQRFQLSDIAFRAYNDNQTVGELDGGTNPNYYDYLLTQVDPTIHEGYRRERTIWDLFSHETTEKDSVTWFDEGALDGDAGMTAEAGAFSQLHVNDPEAKSVPLKKVTALWKQSDEILTDAPRFVTHVNSRADYRLDVVSEDQLVSGNGSGNNITGILNASGIMTASAAGYNLAFIESLLAKKTAIRKATPHFTVDTLLIADEDYDTIMTLKNSSDQYVLGGPLGIIYGNKVTVGDVLWNTIRIVPTPALTSGTTVLGAFKDGATVYEHVTGRRFDVGYDGTDFSHGLVTFRAYQRFALAVEYPKAFCKYTVSGSTGSTGATGTTTGA